MVHTYQITGMTCASCEANVKKALLSVKNVTDANVSKDNNSATITMNKHVELADLQKALDSRYRISALQPDVAEDVAEEETRTWLETYKPILLIFLYITSVTLLVQYANAAFDFMQWMRHFMAGFFLVFSFFKFLNLKGFAESYVMYDVLSKRFPAWSYIYAFVELALGIAFLLNFNPVVTIIATVVVMSISIIGVLQTVLNKKKIRCACLGAVFNLPMSTVTIIEDGLMIVMGVAMLVMM